MEMGEIMEVVMAMNLSILLLDNKFSYKKRKMKQLIVHVSELLLSILPFLKKKDARKLKEFSELITGQFEFLVNQLERMMKDYFQLSDRIKDMHDELYKLREEMAQAASQKCGVKDCQERK